MISKNKLIRSSKEIVGVKYYMKGLNNTYYVLALPLNNSNIIELEIKEVKSPERLASLTEFSTKNIIRYQEAISIYQRNTKEMKLLINTNRKAAKGFKRLTLCKNRNTHSIQWIFSSWCKPETEETLGKGNVIEIENSSAIEDESVYRYTVCINAITGKVEQENITV